MNATERAMRDVIQQWDDNEPPGTTPDQPAADPDDERVEMLYRVACSCGC